MTDSEQRIAVLETEVKMMAKMQDKLEDKLEEIGNAQVTGFGNLNTQIDGLSKIMTLDVMKRLTDSDKRRDRMIGLIFTVLAAVIAGIIMLAIRGN